jgi:hypothetical protein
MHSRAITTELRLHVGFRPRDGLLNVTPALIIESPNKDIIHIGAIQFSQDGIDVHRERKVHN